MSGTVSGRLLPLLQGLLCKQPQQRLAWPELLSHPFVVESAEEEVAREAAKAESERLALERHGRSRERAGAAPLPTWHMRSVLTGGL